MEMLRHASLFAILTLILGLIPLVIALVYVARPTERHLALVRPLFLAGFFATLTGGVIGFINVLRGFALAAELTADVYRVMAIGAAESLVPMFVGFACLTVGWLLVAVGMGRDAAHD